MRYWLRRKWLYDFGQWRFENGGGCGEGFLFVIWSGGNVSVRSAICLFDFLNWESLIISDLLTV